MPDIDVKAIGFVAGAVLIALVANYYLKLDRLPAKVGL